MAMHNVLQASTSKFHSKKPLSETRLYTHGKQKQAMMSLQGMVEF